MRGKSLLNENAIINLSLDQSEWRKLLRSASSRIGFSLDTGIEERACRSSCRPLFLYICVTSSFYKVQSVFIYILHICAQRYY